ncbi:MAG TPA: serine hydrolase domain-containing protein [Acidimicrobiales bacterium]|nr:serine hydrolase domain-containing protein [Acidimicrobiales bacterium]
MAPLDQVARWPVTAAAVGVVGSGPDNGPIAGPTEVGDVDRPYPWASVTKPVTALAVLVAVEEGTLDLDEPAGPPGSTVRHLLAHASGLGPEGRAPLSPPGRRRIYSNAGFEWLAAHLAERSGMPFALYLADGVLGPLAMDATVLPGGASPASGLHGPLRDLLRLAHELATPTLISATIHELATSVAFPGLAGVLPGFGRFDPCDWGLGVEIRGAKHPHWTGDHNAPATFGHFGQSGSFLWVDPVAGLACAGLADRPFGPWAAEAWPRLADALLAEPLPAAGPHPGPDPDPR